MANTEFIEPQDQLIGQVVGGEFTVKKKIGSGGMGSVYRAVQHVTERPVALKVLHAHLVDGMFLKRFTQEARIISRLSHPNIVTIFKYGQGEEGSLYIAMEFVDGSNLGDLIIPDLSFELERALPLMIQMADALAYAHEKKIIHRDIKPDNIVLTKAGRQELIKILDFGVAKILGDGYIKTKTGALCGSPPYMSPEQWKQERDVDGRSDIYSLGVVFYRLVTGTLPFTANTTVGYMKAHLNHSPTAPIELSESVAEYPQIDEIIMRCIRRERDERFPDAYALLEELKELQAEISALTRGSSSSIPAASPVPLPSYLDPTPFAGDDSYRESIEVSYSLNPQRSSSLALPMDERDLVQSPSSSADNLPAKSSGTNLVIAARKPSSSQEVATLRSSFPPAFERLREARLRSIPPSELENQEYGGQTSAKTHLMLVVTGSILLLFLLLSGIYFWLTTPSPARRTTEEPINRSTIRELDRVGPRVGPIEPREPRNDEHINEGFTESELTPIKRDGSDRGIQKKHNAAVEVQTQGNSAYQKASVPPRW